VTRLITKGRGGVIGAGMGTPKGVKGKRKKKNIRPVGGGERGDLG